MSEKKDKIIELFKDQHIFKVYSVEKVNNNPHPYCITEKHITGDYISITDESIKALEKQGKASCGMYVKGDKYVNGYKKGYTKCTIPFEDHTYDEVCFLQLLRDTTDKEAKEVLTPIVKEIELMGLDGVAFVDTDEKFRINE